MIPPAADGAPSMHKPWPQGKFLQQAITNVREAFPFPKDIHYMIARGGFLDRLSKFQCMESDVVIIPVDAQSAYAHDFDA